MNYATLESQLKGDYREVLSKVILYITSKNISDSVAQEKICDLYEILLTAQYDSKPVNKIVGNDIARFCKDYFSDYTLKERFLSIFTWLFRCMLFLCVFEVICTVSASDSVSDITKITSDIAPYSLGILCGVMFNFIVAEIILPLSFKGKKIPDWVYLSISAVIFIVLFAIALNVPAPSIEVPSYILIIISGAYTLVYLIGLVIYRRKKYGTIKNPAKQIMKDSYYKNLTNKDFEKAILEGWQARYKRLSKRGRITEEEYLSKLIKEQGFNEKFDTLYKIIFGVLIVAFAIPNLKDGVLDTLLLLGIMGVFEYLIYKLFIGTQLKFTTIEKNLINECIEKKKTMPSYIEEKLKEY